MEGTLHAMYHMWMKSSALHLLNNNVAHKRVRWCCAISISFYHTSGYTLQDTGICAAEAAEAG